MIDHASSLATWWSYAEADSSVLGVVVAVLSVAAVAFVATRAFARVRRRR